LEHLRRRPINPRDDRAGGLGFDLLEPSVQSCRRWLARFGGVSCVAVELLVCNRGGVLDGMPANASMHSGCVAERDLITGL